RRSSDLNVPGAIASMILGTVSSVGWQLAGLVDSTGIDPMGIGIVCSTLAIIIVSLATQRSHPVPDHVLAALREPEKIGAIPAHLLAGQNDALAGQLPKPVGGGWARVRGLRGGPSGPAANGGGWAA